jgi:hypothetical protein
MIAEWAAGLWVATSFFPSGAAQGGGFRLERLRRWEWRRGPRLVRVWIGLRPR